MPRVLTALLLLSLVPLSPAVAEDVGCGGDLIVYSGGDGLVNAGGLCGAHERTFGPGVSTCDEEADRLVGEDCPVTLPVNPVPDTRILLPGDVVRIGLLDVEGPAELAARMDGLGHDATPVVLHRLGTRFYESDPVAIAGDGELRVSVVLPDGARLETVYRTLPIG